MFNERLLPDHRSSLPARLAQAAFTALTTLTLTLTPTAAAEAEPPPDKSRYTFLDPTPDALLRDLNADRPDKTESPFTVDAGHVQLEMDVANATYDRHDGGPGDTRTSITEVALANLKLGVLNDLDLQLGLPAWREEKVHDATLGTTTRARGFTDLVPRVKWSLWGNDGGRTALALLPFAKVPTATGDIGNGAWEGGLKIPLGVEAGDWDVTFMTEFDWVRNEAGSGHHPEFVNSVSVGREVCRNLSLAVEFFSAVGAGSGAPEGWVGTVDTWVTYRVSRDLQVDAGVYLGVTTSADDWHPFLGLTWRH